MGRRKIGQCTECGRHMRSDSLKRHSKVHAKARHCEVKKYEMKNGAPVVNRLENNQANVGGMPSPRQQHSLLDEGLPSIKVQRGEENISVVAANANNDDQSKVRESSTQTTEMKDEQHEMIQDDFIPESECPRKVFYFGVLLDEDFPSIKVQRREENTSIAAAAHANNDDDQRKVGECSTQTAQMKDERHEMIQDDFIPESECSRTMFYYASFVLEWTDLPINDVYKLEEIHNIDGREAARIKNTSDAEFMVFLPQAFLNRLLGTKLSHFRRRHTGEGFDVFQLL